MSSTIKSIVDRTGGETGAAPTSSSSSSVKSEVELAQSRLHSPIIDPDEEVNEDDAFNSDDELLYAEFFPSSCNSTTTGRSRSNSINPAGSMNANNGVNNTTAAAAAAVPHQQQPMNMMMSNDNNSIMSTTNNTTTNNAPHAMNNNSSRMETRRSVAAAAAAAAAASATTSNDDYHLNTKFNATAATTTVDVDNSLRRYSGVLLPQQQQQQHPPQHQTMTTRSRSSSIAIIDEHGIGGGNRSRIFSIDFDRECAIFLSPNTRLVYLICFCKLSHSNLPCILSFNFMHM